MIEHTIQGDVTRLDQLRDGDGRYLTGTVNVDGNVNLTGLGLEQLPVRFGAVGGNFWCSGNRLTSLVGVHRILRRIDGGLYLWGNPIASGGIGLLLVEGLTEIYANQFALRIVWQHLGQGKRGLLRCQEALHEAGFEAFARL